MAEYVERCALCGRADTDDQWLWLTVSRYDQEVDCEFEEVELAFCRREHAGEYLMTHELVWPKAAEDDRRAGTRADVFFFGCGVIAIALSMVGVVAILRLLI